MRRSINRQALALFRIASIASGRPHADVRRALVRHWGALGALGLFLLAGLWVIDDYGVMMDEEIQRSNVASTMDYVAGRGFTGFAFPASISLDDLVETIPDLALYGSAFEAPLFLAGKILGIENERGVHLYRHLMTHLFFLCGGLFAYLLACRLSGNRLIGLAALALFLLHPRLYAHSFFNSKDSPFAVMFIISLYLTHRAFRRGAPSAFMLLGAAVGALVNLRIMGLVLVAAILAMRALDLALAQGKEERKRVLATTSAFALAAGLTVYALLPYLWGDPIRGVLTWWATLSNHPYVQHELFRGSVLRSVDFPAEYLATWFSISSPPFALLLGAVGMAGALARGAGSPIAAFRNTRLRFTLLLAGCAAVPALAVILLDLSLHNGWRHMHFLWAPFSLLAALGLRSLTSALRQPLHNPRRPSRAPSPAAFAASSPLVRRGGEGACAPLDSGLRRNDVRLCKGLLRRTPRLRAAAYGAAAAGVAATLVSMALIHPNQQVFFNFLVDRTAPEHLRTQYRMDFLGHPVRQAFEWILAERPSSAVGASLAAPYALHLLEENASILPEDERGRIAAASGVDGFVFSILDRAETRPSLAAHRIKTYNNTIVTIERKDHLRPAYEARRRQDPIISRAYDVYRTEGAIGLIMEPCAPAFLEKTELWLRLTPVSEDDLPYWRRDRGFDVARFPLSAYGALFDGKCVASAPLPDYAVAELDVRWDPELLGKDAARDAMRRAKEEGRLLKRAASDAAYDVYLSDGELAYINESCDPADTEGPFHLNVFSERGGDLPEERRELGFERFHFEFYLTGALLQDACAAFFPLPSYPVAAIQTGQQDGQGGDLWFAEFWMNPGRRWAEAREGASGEPLARGAFDVHVTGGALVYVKEPCGLADTEDRFFAHVFPERADDLPEGRRQYGFDNLDFDFFPNGALFEGRCAARAALPDYRIASIRTGQHRVGEGETWSVEFSVEGDAR